MPNPFFQFKQFIVHQQESAMKVTTDGCLFGAWVASRLKSLVNENNQPQSLTTGNKRLQALDIGTGTGLLALMIRQQTDITIDAIEIVAATARQAQANASASPWSADIRIIQDDIRSWTPGKTYDVIFSNPPFYENELKGPDVFRNTAHHGELLTWKELFAITSNLLSPGGLFYFLLPQKREAEIERLCIDSGLVPTNMVSVKAAEKKPAFRVMLEGKKIAGKADTTVTQLAVRDGEGNYTPGFSMLLRDYYLHL